MDIAYQSRYIGVARTLLEASGGDPSGVPVHYADHLRHEYVGGDISLAHLLPKFEYVGGLEDYEIEEAIVIFCRMLKPLYSLVIAYAF